MANRLRKCGHCKKMHPVDKGHVFNLSFFCSIDHAVAHSHARGVKAVEAKKALAEKVAKITNKAALKRLRKTPRAEALELAQLLARVSNADDNGYCTCVSCGLVMKWNECDGGHFIAKGDSSYWALDPRNINPQCKPDNAYGMKHGTAAITYTRWMVNKYGQEFVDEMIATKKTTVKRPSVFYADYIKETKALIAEHRKRIGV